MFVIYTPEGDTEQRWEWDPKKVRGIEAEEIEARMHPLMWDEFQMALLKGGARARRVLLWHLQKKTHASLKLEDVDYAMGELQVEFSAPELHQLRAQLAEATGIDEQQREAALAAIDKELESAADADGAAGKAPSNSAA
jgi:hypothetical protein